MLETLVTNRGMLFNPKYGRVGTGVLPMFTAAEAIGPLVEGLGYVLLPVAWYLGALDVEFFVVFLLLTSGFGIFLSWFGILSEAWSFNRYEDPRQILRLLWYGILENVGYRQWKTVVAWQGLFQYLRGEGSWGAMERTGFGTSDDDSDGPDSGSPGVADAGTEGSGAVGTGSETPGAVEAGSEGSTSDGTERVEPDGAGFQWWGDGDDEFRWGEDRGVESTRDEEPIRDDDR
jgi:hypothetical protein